MEAIRKAVVKRLSALQKGLLDKDQKLSQRLENEMFSKSNGCKQTYNQLITKLTCKICQMNTTLVANDAQFWEGVTVNELLDCDPSTIIQNKKREMESKLSGHLQSQITGRNCIYSDCQGKNVSYNGVQKRGADEPETLYFYCPDCRKSWQDEE